MAGRYIDIAEVAKIIRGELKREFPKCKFSVRSERYSMGTHISVSWSDGPTVKEVESITDNYYGTGFDGMTDSSTHHDGVLNGERVHFAGSRPSCSREITKDFEALCAQAWSLMSEIERFRMTRSEGFPGWPEDRPGYRLAITVSA